MYCREQVGKATSDNESNVSGDVLLELLKVELGHRDNMMSYFTKAASFYLIFVGLIVRQAFDF